MSMIISVWFEIYEDPAVTWDAGKLRSSRLPDSVLPIFRSLRAGLSRESKLPPGWQLTDFCYAWIRPAGVEFTREEEEFLERTTDLVVSGSTLVYSLLEEDDCALLVSRYKTDFGAFRDSVIRIIRKNSAKPDVSTVRELPTFLGLRA